MKRYELVFLTKPALEKKELEKIFADLEKEIKKQGAKVAKKEEWGKKSLVYPIKEEKEACFWIWQLAFKDQVNLLPINAFLNKEANIIRYLFLADRRKKGR